MATGTAIAESKGKRMLRRKLFLGLVPLLAIVLSVGIPGVLLITKLGGSIDLILRENYASVVACQNMKESAERMDSGLAFALEGEEARGHQLFQQHVPLFEKNLQIELHNITLPGENELAHKLQKLEQDYLQLANQFFAMPSGKRDRNTIYFRQLLPTFTEIKDTAQTILEMNQQNMVDADRQARSESSRSTRLLIATMALGLVISILIAYYLARSLLKPIHALTDSAIQLGEGNLDQVVPVISKDELGQLAEAFNKMASKLRSYRQSTTEKIIRAQQTMESTLAAFPDPILVFSKDRQIELTNPEAKKFLQKVGHISDLPAPLSPLIDAVIQQGVNYQPTSFDKTVALHIDGEEIFFLPRILSLKNESGEVFGAVLVLQDVTRFRLADDVKTNLIATVSHELKTPLTGMQMAIYLLLEEKVGPLTPQQTDLLLTARGNSDRLLHMIEDLLDLARFERGNAVLSDSEQIAPKTLIDDATADLQNGDLLKNGAFKIDVQVEPSLPEVKVSRLRISQVFTNLLSNAVKYSPTGGIIEISAKKVGKMIRFAVRDQGIGISPEHQKHIFEKFFRVSDTSQDGVGLGLAISREIIQAHGGSMGVESAEGQGSEFYFFLPISERTTTT